jgi:quercetin dioxygenase-like cupin family protein
MPALEIKFSHRLVGIPNKTIVSLRVEFPPNGSTPPHRHGGANVGAFVLKGTVFNKMNDEPMKLIKEGESWFEAPGCHHRISDNASQTEPATVVATIITDTDAFERDGMGALIQIDEEYLNC